MISCFALDGNGDLLIDTGSFVLNEDSNAIGTMLQFALNKVKGDWFLDLNQGLDYFGAIFGKKKIDLELVSEFKIAITSVIGVTGIAAFEANITSRGLNINFRARTIFSTPQGAGEIAINDIFNPIG